MRLDKYLKVSRLIKRRSVAAEACGSDRVTVNGKTAKPSHTVVVGDVLEIRFGANRTKVEILSVSEHATKETAAAMFRQLEA